MKPIARIVAVALPLAGLMLETPRAGAADVESVTAALGVKLLPAGQPARELRAFMGARIVAPPEFSDRAEWEAAAERLRREMLEQIVFRGQAAGWRDADCQVEWLDSIDGGPGYTIRKLRYEALPGMWIPALLYTPDNLSGPAPLALNVNGHDADGKAADYKQLRSINLVKRGLIVLNVEWFGMGQLRTSGFHHGRMNQLDLCGASGLAPFYLAMSRAIDLGLELEHADPSRVLVAGLSGGGWQTILISSLDRRVTLANPVAGYGSFHTNLEFEDMGDSEQAPSDMAALADYTHLTALRAPRPTLLTYNTADNCCFKSGHTLNPLLEAARPIFALYGAGDHLRSHVNHEPGTHNFEQENREKLYAMVGDHFFPDQRDFVLAEIPSEAEIKTSDELHVPLPEDNVDFHRLAESLVEKLPPQGELPRERDAAESWQRQQRDRLKSLLRISRYDAEVSDEKTRRLDDLQVTTRRFRLAQDWSVPAVEIGAADVEPRGTVLLVCDEGRKAAAEEAARLLADGWKVVAVDPLFWGESEIEAQDPKYTFALFLASVGERPLGIQAGQLAAIAGWLREQNDDEPIELLAIGRRASVAALVAAAIESGAIGNVELAGGLASFRQLIEEDVAVDKLPELFPFGLLREFDVSRLVALAAPRRVEFRDADERVRRELAELEAWYGLFGGEF